MRFTLALIGMLLAFVVGVFVECNFHVVNLAQCKCAKICGCPCKFVPPAQAEAQSHPDAPVKVRCTHCGDHCTCCDACGTGDKQKCTCGDKCPCCNDCPKSHK